MYLSVTQLTYSTVYLYLIPALSPIPICTVLIQYLVSAVPPTVLRTYINTSCLLYIGLGQIVTKIGNWKRVICVEVSLPKNL